MTLQQFIDKYKGQTLGYPEGSYVGECLSLVKVYMKELYGFNPPPSGCNAARCYWSKFPAPLGDYFIKVAKTPGNVPSPGDIVVWNENSGGGFGHIAIFVSGDVNSFTSFDQNYYGQHAHLQKHNYNNVYGWLTPLKPENGAVGGQMLSYLGANTEKEAKARLKEHLGERDGKCNWGAVRTNSKGELTGDSGGFLGSERVKTKKLEDQIKQLEGKLDDAASYAGNLEDNVEKLQTELAASQDTNKSLTQTNAQLQANVQALQAQIEEMAADDGNSQDCDCDKLKNEKQELVFSNEQLRQQLEKCRSNTLSTPLQRVLIQLLERLGL